MIRRLIDLLEKADVWHAVAALVLLVASTTVLVGNGWSIMTLMASSAASVNETDSVLYFMPHSTSTLEVGDSVDVDVRVNAHVAINTLGATVKFPVDHFQIIGISKENSFFDLWTEDTEIKESAGEVHFSGGTLAKGGLTGVGTVLTLKLKAIHSGDAKLSFQDVQVFAADGTGKMVQNDARTLSYTIPEALEESIASTGGSKSGEILPALSIDFNSDGKINVIDLSILAYQILSPYDVRFDLNRDGAVNLADVSIFFSRVHQ